MTEHPGIPLLCQRVLATTLVASARIMFAAQLLDSVVEWREPDETEVR